MQIETDRLLLREFQSADWKAVHEYACDPEVCRFMTWGPNTVDDTLRFIDQQLRNMREKPRRIYDFAATIKESGKLIGSCGITLVPNDYQQGVLGYCFNRNYWRQGYGKEACTDLIEFGFSKFDLHRIYAICDADNVGSAGVLRKAGMRQEAHFVKDMSRKGDWRDTLFFAMLKNEWKRGSPN